MVLSLLYAAGLLIHDHMPNINTTNYELCDFFQLGKLYIYCLIAMNVQIYSKNVLCIFVINH